MKTPLDQLPTPFAVVDMSRVRGNLDIVHSYARSNGLQIAPHTKTHKDPVMGQLQLKAGAHCLTVATPREAEVMATVTQRLLVAYPPVEASRIQRLLALPSSVELIIALDSAEAQKRLSEAALKADRRVEVLVELDLGGRRTGTQTPQQSADLAKLVDAGSHTSFAGVMVHPGNLRLKPVDPAESRDGERPSDRPSAANVEAGDPGMRRLRADLKAHLKAIEALGLTARIVSGGNTPTLFSSHLVPEMTEIRPGTYIYSDRDIASQGVLPWSSCAYSILCTVVSTSVPGQAVVDAGSKALGKEPLHAIEGYGALLDHPEVPIKALSEEHGIVDLSETDFRPQVGDRLRVVPNHVCLSVHLQEELAFLDGDALELRPVVARGR